MGLVSGACFAEMGIDVTCVDIDAEKIERLGRGEVPIYEPGLEDMLRRNIAAGRLHFTTDLGSCIDRVEVVFSAVGTPAGEDGQADLRYVLAVAETFGRTIDRYTLLVMKSTVPVGTTRRVEAIVRAELEKRGAEVDFDVVSNPEFLKEGAAIKDFMSPDRVVIGVESERAKAVMTRLYRPFLVNEFRFYFMDIASAEMTKYASNAMLATRISFMNDIANLCERVGADANMVRVAMGADSRIGRKFLYPGCGYGGSCFPKDVKALIRIAEQNGYPMRVLQAVDEVNERQKSVLFEKLSRIFGDRLCDLTVAVWGLSFKPETDDMREAPSLAVIERLLAAGCKVRVYDPMAMEECRRRLGERVEYGRDKYDAAAGADAMLLVTEWKELRMPSWQVMRRIMRGNVIIDGRNIYDRAELADNGFEYHKIG